MLPEKDIFIIDKEETFTSFIETLKNSFKVEFVSRTKKTIALNDSFDWRLFKSNSCLISHSKGFTLQSADEPELEIKTNKKYYFARDFPECDLKNKLQKILCNRKLCRNFKTQQLENKIEILNSENKIIFRMSKFNFKYQGTESTSFTIINFKPLKGYLKEYRKIKKIAAEANIFPSQRPLPELLILGFENPGEYISKPDYRILSEMPAWMAMKNIYSDLLNQMLVNEEGLIKNIDAEFLHDFRVAVRRTRSALSLIKKIFPEEENAKFKKEFKNIQLLTNYARDLDVDIENKSSYKDLLPTGMHRGIDSLTGYLKKERTTEQKKLIRLLKSEKYKKTIKNWNKVLGSFGPSMEDCGNTFKPVKELASQTILKTFNKTLKAGNEITPDSPDEKFHEFRIALKRLRYLLEFFTIIYSEKEMAQILKQLKIMQDNLGEFNDLCIQTDKLTAYIKNLKLNSEESKEIIASTGGLIAIKSARKMKVREDFFNLYAGYIKPTNIRRYNRVFQKEQI